MLTECFNKRMGCAIVAETSELGMAQDHHEELTYSPTFGPEVSDPTDKDTCNTITNPGYMCRYLTLREGIVSKKHPKQ
jgi:hypothetical protein